MFGTDADEMVDNDSIVDLHKLSLSDTFKSILKRTLHQSLTGKPNAVAEALGMDMLNIEQLLIEKFLRFPSLQPDYRHDRPHTDFVTNLGVDPAELRDALRASWNAVEPLAAPPLNKITALLGEKYSRVEWNGKF